MPAVKSVLKGIIEAFPEKTTIKGSNIEAMLKKKGTTADELKFANLTIDDAKRYDAAQLKELEAGRKDIVETVEQGYKQFDWVSLHDDAINSTYKEKITTFKQAGQSSPKLQTADSISADINELYDEYNIPDTITFANIDLAEDVPLDVVRRIQTMSQQMLAADEAEAAGKTFVGTESRYTSEHFGGQEDYLMHNRVYDDTLDGTPTRVLEEVQSDLHQQGRQAGYGTGDKVEVITEGEREIIKRGMYEEPGSDAWEAFNELIQTKGFNFDVHEDPFNFAGLLLEGKPVHSKIPESPYQKTWLKKGIERELVDAMNEGRQQLAIPIKGQEIGKLQRAEGVQKWYETQVASTAKKVAKSIDADFEMKTVTGKTVNAISGIEAANLRRLLLEVQILAPSDRDGRLNGIIAITSNPTVLALLDNIKQGLLTPMDALPQLKSLKAVSTMEYAIIKPKGEVLPASTAKLKALKERREITGAEMNSLYDELGDTEEYRDASQHLFEQENKLAAEIAATEAGAFKAKPFTMNLYSTPVAGGFAAYMAYKQGATDDDIRQHLAGQDEEDIEAALVMGRKIESAIAEGATEDEVREYLMSQQPQEVKTETVPKEPQAKGWWQKTVEFLDEASELETRAMLGTTVGDIKSSNAEVKNKAYNELVEGQGSLEDFAANMEVVYPNMVSVFQRTEALAGDEEAVVQATNAEKASRLQIIKHAADLGVQLEWRTTSEDIGTIFDTGEWMAIQQDGSAVPITPGFWASMRAESGEIKGAIAGGFGGAKLATMMKVPGPWWAKAGAGLASSLGFAALGGAVGSQFDYVESAIELQQNLNAEIANARARDAAQASIIGDVLMYPVAKGIGYGWEGIKQAKAHILAGNKGGAHIALKESMMLADDEAEYIVEQLARVADVPGKGTDKEIAAFMITQPGGETVMKVAGSLDSTANRAVSKGIDNRAKDLLSTTAELTDESIGKVLKQDLANYTADVKTFYGKVKAEAANTPNMNRWSFKYDALGISPVLEAMEKQIVDVPGLERFLRRSELIRARADGRTFADLLDLRQMVNEFRFGRGNKKATELQVYKDLITKIDSAVDNGAHVVLENPKQWLGDFALARKNYAQMKDLEKNVLYRVLNRSGVNEKTIANGLTRYITAIDETWTDVMAKLPPTMRGKAENAVINTLANKYTAGAGEGLQAVNFPMLADELRKTTFTDPAARNIKGAISRLADVFKNDVPLAQHTGNIVIPKEQSYLTTDPIIRMKYEFASSVFNRVKKLLPTKSGRNLALIMRTADLLENPLNVKSAKALMEEVGDSMNLAPQVLELQRAAANEAAKSKPSAIVKLYGDGNTLSPKGTGKETKLHITRIATPDDITKVLEAEGIAASDSKALEQALRTRGYQAFVLGTEKVKLL